MKKRAICFTLAVLMIITAFSTMAIPAFAASYNGTCGENLTWELDTSSGVLTISGNGWMDDYHVEDSFSSCAPWYGIKVYIKSIVINDGVKGIGPYAFLNCSKLLSVTIPNSVEYIGGYAFYGCYSLLSVNIPSSVKSIGMYAFYQCSSLTKVNITDIEAWCKIDFIDFRANPLYYAEHLYLNETELTNLIIPEGVISINYYAFYNCTSLTSVSFPKSVWSIGAYAFYGCSSLSSVDIPNNVDGIIDYTFANCSSLTSVRIPKNLEYISKSAFLNCSNLKTIYYGGNEKDWENIYFGDKAIFENVTIIFAVCEHEYDNACDTTCNICGKEREITHSYSDVWSRNSTNHWYECSVCKDKKDIAAHIFDNACDTTCNICNYRRTTSHQYKSTWSTDGTQHWHECSVCHDKKDVANHIFENACDTICETCGYTREITHKYSDTWSKDGTNHWHECLVCHDKKDIAKHTYDENYICTSCGYADRSCGENTIWSLDTESGILTISGTGEMFDYDDGAKLSPWHNQISCIKSVVICEGVTNIGNYAFYNCRYLVTIMISESVTDIGDSAFAACTNLGSIDVAAGNKNYYSEGNCLIQINTKILILGCKNSIIPNGVLGIGDFAFAYCSSLSSINIPESVTSIENHAFYGCTALIAIFIPKNVANIEALAFSACTNLGSIDVATENKSYYSEGNCLIQINTKILILGCKNSIIPNNIVGIGDFAFAYCNSLSSISIPKSITSIGSNAFYGCSALVSLIIPKSVVNIGENAFADCVGLEKLYYGGTEEDWQRITVNYEIYIIIYIEFSYCEHEYDNVCDAVCNICNKERTAPHKYSAKYSSDDANHWYECELCHNKKEIFGHNCGEDGLCVVCGFVIYIHGDLDGVEGVTSDDAIYLLYAIYFPNSYPVNQNCDFDGNGEVTSDDAIYLLYHVYFKNEYPI